MGIIDKVLSFKIGADSSKYERAIKRSKSKTTSFATGAVKSFKSIAKQAVLLAGVTGIGAIGISAINVGMQFEKSMATVSGVMRSTAAETKALTAIAQEMGEKTEFSATQAAQGLQFLGMAGFNAAKSIEALPGVLDLATASGIELGQAADIASNALTAMQLPASQLGRVNDVLIGTITRANTDMEMLAESMKYAAPLANAYGDDIESLSAMIGILGNAGIQGSMAGTALAKSYQLVDKVFEKLGVDGTGKDLLDAFEAIKKSGMSNAEIMEIFGDRAGKAALILKDMIPEVKGLESSLRGAEGEAKSLADTMRDNVSGSFDALKSKIEAAGIGVFYIFRDAIKAAVDNMSSYIDKVNETIRVLQRLSDTGLEANLRGQSETLMAEIKAIEDQIASLKQSKQPGGKEAFSKVIEKWQGDLDRLNTQLGIVNASIDSLGAVPDPDMVGPGTPGLGHITNGDNGESEAAKVEDEAKVERAIATGEAMKDIWLSQAEDKYEILSNQYQAEIDLEAANLEAATQMKRDFWQIQIDDQARVFAESTKMEKELARQKKEIEKAKYSATKETVGNIIKTGKMLLNNAESDNRAIFEVTKAASIAQATMSTYAGAANAMRDVPYPYNFVVAGSVIAYGLARVADIASQSFSTSSASGGGGGSAYGAPVTSDTTAPVYDVASTVDETEQKGNLTINIEGDVLADDYYIERLAEKISDAVESYDVRLVATSSKTADALA